MAFLPIKQARAAALQGLRAKLEREIGEAIKEGKYCLELKEFLWSGCPSLLKELRAAGYSYIQHGGEYKDGERIPEGITIYWCYPEQFNTAEFLQRLIEAGEEKNGK